MFQKWAHAIARMFTVPAKVRQQINANPLTEAAKTLLLSDLTSSLSAAVDKNILDPTLNAAAKTELASLLSATGLLK